VPLAEAGGRAGDAARTILSGRGAAGGRRSGEGRGTLGR
jgi:hypothetical protein